ncbi:hypothetical protein QBC35DRAFT_522767 [Podospora australis]|uniref:RBR-type E3 ubiquitin transferase n=1 Tax=Podospora australis TaxID=1536484 RepID=A0AAN7AHA0_9PEZI|nr:hypothetical protein QBC35DRAFT_522767 [Podospora australis]
MDLNDLDPLTLSLILQMQLDDLRDLAESANKKGKGRDGEVPDFTVAIETYRTDLSGHAQILADRAMSSSIARAVNHDGDAIRALQAEEDRDAHDREMALRLSGRPMPDGAATPRGNAQPYLTDEMMDKMKALGLHPTDEDRSSSSPAESSSWAATRRPIAALKSTNLASPKKVPKEACVACGDKHHAYNIVTCVGCTHRYCRECIASLFQTAMTDETLFPPRCCGKPIPLDLCRPFLSPQLAGQFQAKKVEFGTPNRTYCSQPNCSTFIPPQGIKADVATCGRCCATTCVSCKKAAHAGTDCPDDQATRDLLDLARAEGWQRCYSCARFVELNTGCNHITCRCSAQFCYVCGDRWKSCSCPQWEEARLLDRANALVDRNARAPQAGQPGRANLVERERQNLMANHQCEHRSWGSRSGRHRCEECHDTLPNYIYECRQCRIMACRRCRFNRFT